MIMKHKLLRHAGYGVFSPYRIEADVIQLLCLSEDGDSIAACPTVVDDWRNHAHNSQGVNRLIFHRFRGLMMADSIH